MEPWIGGGEISIGPGYSQAGYTWVGPIEQTGGVPYPGGPGDRRGEYVSGGLVAPLPSAKQVLAREVEDVAVEFGGDMLWRLMLNDPTVVSSVEYIKRSALADGYAILPRIPGPKPEQPESPDQRVAAESAAHLGRCVEALTEPLLDVVYQMLDAFSLASMLAEIVCEDAAGRPGGWGLDLKSIKVKPRNQWQFVVDPFSNVVGILARVVWPRPTQPPPGEAPAVPPPPVPAGGTYAVLPPDKFAWMSWSRRDGDPRGRSGLRPAFSAWNMKVQTTPQYFRFLTRYANPPLVGTTSEHAASRPLAAANNQPIPGAGDVTPQQSFLDTLTQFANGGMALTVPYGSTVVPLESKGGSEIFTKALDWQDRQIVRAILISPRATVEAMHGSRADSQTSQDVTGNLILAVKQMAERWVQSILDRLHLWNYGPALAHLAPVFTLGSNEHQDKSTAQAEYFKSWPNYPWTLTQMMEMEAELGLPVRGVDSEPFGAAAEAAAVQAAADAAAAAAAQAPPDQAPPAPAAAKASLARAGLARSTADRRARDAGAAA